MLVNRFYYLIIAFGMAGCASEEPPPQSKEVSQVDLPVVNDERTDLILTWFADGGPAVGSSVDEVPEAARREVRVQDPGIPPESRDPSVIYITDLSAPTKNGNYPVKAVKRADWESKRRALLEAKLEAAKKEAAKSAQANPGLAVVPQPGGAPVVMYATKHCPVCIKARRWLLEHKIPYIEHDIEKDMNAAKALQAKGRAQGVSTAGVPIFEIGGRLIPGFDPATITKMLTAMAGAQTI